jgi:hypothetical protein
MNFNQYRNVEQSAQPEYKSLFLVENSPRAIIRSLRALAPLAQWRKNPDLPTSVELEIREKLTMLLAYPAKLDAFADWHLKQLDPVTAGYVTNALNELGTDWQLLITARGAGEWSTHLLVRQQTGLLAHGLRDLQASGFRFSGDSSKPDFTPQYVADSIQQFLESIKKNFLLPDIGIPAAINAKHFSPPDYNYELFFHNINQVPRSLRGWVVHRLLLTWLADLLEGKQKIDSGGDTFTYVNVLNLHAELMEIFNVGKLR